MRYGYWKVLSILENWTHYNLFLRLTCFVLLRVAASCKLTDAYTKGLTYWPPTHRQQPAATRARWRLHKQHAGWTHGLKAGWLERTRGGGSYISPPFPASCLASAGASKGPQEPKASRRSPPHKETAAITPTKVSFRWLLMKCRGFVALHHVQNSSFQNGEDSLYSLLGYDCAVW